MVSGPVSDPAMGVASVVRVLSSTNKLTLPTFLELRHPVSAEGVQAELVLWGHQCDVTFIVELHLAICFPTQEAPVTTRIYLPDAFCEPLRPLYNEIEPSIVSEFSVLHDMKFLHQHGYSKAVVTSSFELCHRSQLVLFREPEGSMAERQTKDRPPPAWPEPQPQGTSGQMFVPAAAPTDTSDCRLNLGIDAATLKSFFNCSDFCLHTSFEGLDLPAELHAFLANLPLLADRTPDRYIVYVDGSSQGHQDHRPVEWIEEQGIADAWAMIALAETYQRPDAPHQLFLVGWTSQQVRLDPNSPFYIGSKYTGSLAAEREGLFWSAMWRIGLNSTIPTLFRSDSQLSCDQARGAKGPADLEDSFLCLRGAFQLLETALPRDHLRIEHIHGHNGEPFNDFTDHVAKMEARSSFFHTRPLLDMHIWRPLLPHLWLLFGQQVGAPPFHGDHFAVPAPQLPPENDPAPASQPSGQSRPQQVELQLSFCTANVLSMYTRPDGYSGKVGYLTAQFQDLALLFAGIQEARTPAGQCRSDQTLRLCSGVDHGQGGVELWVNLKQPYGYVRGRPLRLTAHHVQVLHVDSRRLLARVVAPYLDLLLFVGHAPHSGRPDSERQVWWNQTTTLLHQLGGGRAPFVMIDANAAPGARDNIIVFEDGLRSSKSTPLWRAFLEEHLLTLPQTRRSHRGGLGTWTSPDGQDSFCLDYIAIPQHSLSQCTFSALLESFDLGNDQQDHIPVALELQWQLSDQHRMPSQQRGRQTFDRALIRSCNWDHFLDHLPSVSWDEDVETQTRSFNKEILRKLQQRCPVQRAGPKKTFITPDIWELRKHKLRCRQALKDLRRRQACDLLHKALLLWKSPVQQTLDPRPVWGFDYTSTLICGTLRWFVDFRSTARRLKQALKLAKQSGIAEKIMALDPAASASMILHALRPLVGSSNLKNRALAPLPHVLDAHGQPCRSPDEAHTRWIDFFCKMEGGQRIDVSTQRQLWRTNLLDLRASALEVPVQELPPLTALEDAYRKVTTGKATGPDSIPAEICNSSPVEIARHAYPLLLKTLLHGQEPLEHKGGQVVPIWKKKLSQKRCEGYRSILISSHIGKGIHRTLRLHQSSIYEAYLCRQQIGGQRKAPVNLGVHLVRSYLRFHSAHRRPVALIFLDISEAFYRVVRPLAIDGSFSDDSVAAIGQRLGLPASLLEDIRRHLREPCAVQRACLPDHLRRALRALHQDTFWRIGPQQDVCRTTIGTRPGDALADVIFGYLWSRVLQSFQALADPATFDHFVSDQGPRLFGQDVATGTEPTLFMGPCWMDDLCVALSEDDSAHLIPKTLRVTGLLLDNCLEHALTPNLAAGKTEVLLAFRGKGARAQRVQHFGPSANRILPVLGEHEAFQVRAVTHYTHLGCVLHHSGDQRAEIRRRIGIAHRTFTEHRKVLFHDTKITLTKRTELFRTLVLSKFLFGTESWLLTDLRNKEALHSSLIRLCRRLLPRQEAQALSDDQVLSRTGLPSPTELLRIQRLRYLGMLLHCGHLVDWGVLNQDRAWLALLEDDFRWMWHQLQGATHLHDPCDHIGEWLALVRHHRSYWKRLIRRASEHACRQRQREQNLITFHKGIFTFLTSRQVHFIGD